MESTFTHNEMVYAFNEWMRRYIEDPEAFESTWASIKQFQEEGEDDDASYGHNCMNLVALILSER